MASLTFVARRPGPFASLIQVTRLGPFRLEPMAPVRTTDQYWDTEDGELLRAGIALRVRELDGQCTASLRPVQSDRPPSALPAVSQVSVPSLTRTARLDLPAGPFAEAVEEITGADPLRPVLTLRQYRTPRIAFDGDRAVALVSFDVVSFDADGKQVVSNEVEISATEDGTVADLERMKPHLLNHDLEEEQLSKMERGIIRLHRGPGKPLLLLPAERAKLERVADGPDPLLSRRARVLLLDSRGFRADTVAAQTGLSMGRVRHWKQRFQDERLGLFTEMADEVDNAFGSADLPSVASLSILRPIAPVPDVDAGGLDSDVRPASAGDGHQSGTPSLEDGADPRRAEDLDGLLSFFHPKETTTPLLDASLSEEEEDALDAAMPNSDEDDHEIWFDEPALDASAFVPIGQLDAVATEPQAPRRDVSDEGTRSVEIQLPPFESVEHALAADHFSDIGPALDIPQDQSEAIETDQPGEVRERLEWRTPAFVELRKVPDVVEPEPTEAAVEEAAPGPLVRPRFAGDTSVLSAAREALVYAVASFESAADRFLATPDAAGARRIVLTAHRIRLTVETFGPFLPSQAAQRLVFVLRPLVDAADAALDAARTDQEDAQGHVSTALAAVASRLGSGGQRAWGQRVRRLLDRLAAQRADGLLVGDDFPLPADDFVGAPGDVPTPTLLRHVLGSMIWTRFEAVRAFEDDVAEDAPASIAYHFAIAVSGLHFVLGLAEHAAKMSVRDLAQRLDGAETRAMSHRNALLADSAGNPVSTRVLADLWADVTGESFRESLAAFVATI